MKYTYTNHIYVPTDELLDYEDKEKKSRFNEVIFFVRERSSLLTYIYLNDVYYIHETRDRWLLSFVYGRFS